MVGGVLIGIGTLLLLLGVVLLTGWTGGRSRWFGADVYDRPGDNRTDRIFLDLYFVVKVLAPLLGGATMIVYGLRLLVGDGTE